MQGELCLTRPIKPKNHDFATTARNVVVQAAGNELDGYPLDGPNAGRNPGQRMRSGDWVGRKVAAEAVSSKKAARDCDEGSGSEME